MNLADPGRKSIDRRELKHYVLLKTGVEKFFGPRDLPQPFVYCFRAFGTGNV